MGSERVILSVTLRYWACQTEEIQATPSHSFTKSSSVYRSYRLGDGSIFSLQLLLRSQPVVAEPFRLP